MTARRSSAMTERRPKIHDFLVRQRGRVSCVDAYHRRVPVPQPSLPRQQFDERGLIKAAQVSYAMISHSQQSLDTPWASAGLSTAEEAALRHGPERNSIGRRVMRKLSS